MTIKRHTVNDVTRNGSSREPITTVTTVDKALAGRMYRGLARSRVVSTLSQLHIPFPADLPDITASTAFPIRIGDVEDRPLGDLQSYWGAQFARANALLSVARAEAKRLDRVVKRQEKVVFRRYAPDNPRSMLSDAIWGNVYSHKKLALLERKLDSAEALETVLEGLVRDFRTYLEIIQNEMTWRMSERRAIRER